MINLTLKLNRSQTVTKMLKYIDAYMGGNKLGRAGLSKARARPTLKVIGLSLVCGLS